MAQPEVAENIVAKKQNSKFSSQGNNKLNFNKCLSELQSLGAKPRLRPVNRNKKCHYYES